MKDDRLALGIAKKGCYGYSNNGFQDNIDCIIRSWTYGLLTDNEKVNLLEMMKLIQKNIKNLEYKKAWDLASDIYISFIKALGYKSGQFGDREKPRTKETLYNIRIVKDIDGNIKLEGIK